MIENLIKSATCRIVCDTESGTGWLIAKDLIITARHCVLPAIAKDKTVELFFPVTGGAALYAKIVAHSEDWDACLLSVETTIAVEPLQANLELPCDGEDWQTFGYPGSKSAIGHRLSGTIAQALDEPILKIDLDLSVNAETALQSYKGMSGGAVVCAGVAVGVISKKFDGTVAALSLNKMERFLAENGFVPSTDSTTSSTPLLADREDFPEIFAETLQASNGSYLFLEGAHGYGKSTFCGCFRAEDKNLINLGAYCLSDPNSALGADYRAQPQVFLDWIATRVSGLITGHPPRKEEKNYPEQIRQTSQYLDAFSNHCKKSGGLGMFFIDGLNEVPGEALLVQLLGLLPAKLPSHVIVVLTAPNFSNISAVLAGKVKKSDVYKLPPLSDPACHRYCQKVLKPERRSPALIDLICEKAKGHPLYLRYLIEYANLQATDDGLEEFPVLSGPIEEYYQGIWAKLLLDSDTVNLLALMARLRWGLPLKDFTKVLNLTERARFVSVVSKVRHLLADEETTAIYHASFATFIIEQTAAIDESVSHRLAKFCLEQPDIRYCVLNRVFHLSNAGDMAVFRECNQAWFDATVTLGVEPDALIADVDTVVNRAAREASAEEFFSLTLLAQRISFRYDTLFAQSARLIAEALIVLDRPRESLQHVLRLKTLIVSPDDALEIAFLLHCHGYDDDALTLLDRVQQRFVESYDSPMHLGDFLSILSWHIQTVFLVRLSGGWNGMKQVTSLMKMAQRACGRVFKDDPSKRTKYMSSILATSPTYFLTFRDEYADIERVKEYQKTLGISEEKIPPYHLLTQCIALLNFESTVDNYHLPKSRKALAKLFADLAKMIPTAEIDAPMAGDVADTLIRFGAPASVVSLFAAKAGKGPARKIQIKAKNGVDVNHEDLNECLINWRTAAFLDSTFRGPSGGVLTSTDWFESIEHLIGALYCCDGSARRAKADSNDKTRIACGNQLRTQVIEPLRITLQQRATWKNSHAIPENVLPRVYRQLAELLLNCFPEELPEWMNSLVKSTDGQWGMYSEGFRAAIFQVLKELTREKPADIFAPSLLALLHSWRDHVLPGVENRHELVPEILRMIPFFTALGAKEEAERLYQQLLSVSMGPTWYKEDQLGIMTEVLSNITISNEIKYQLPKIAGYLERASGEMTFQRYVLSEKSVLIGQIARRGKYRAALAYFRRQCCGSTKELWAEAEQGPIDKVGQLKGSRFPGGGIDDQAAVLALIQNSEPVSWALRWALLEIFHCGDSRHLTDYAQAFAKIVNEVGASSDFVRRVEIVANAETSGDEQFSFASAFRRELRPELHSAFASALVSPPPITNPQPPEPKGERDIDDDADTGIFHPGLFGRQKALRESEQILAEAGKQWALGNHKAAKIRAVKVLQTAQEGEWGIFDNLSECRRAKDILVDGESNAIDVIRHYAPLIETERHVPKWMIAQQLIGEVGFLLNEMEGQKLLDTVIDHVRLVVGNADQQIGEFDFLADDTPEPHHDVEVFRFIVWLCNHPQWLRRERAAAMLLWLVEQTPHMLAEAVTTAFSMDDGYGPDILCGVLDGASAREPSLTWEKIAGVLDLSKTTQQLRHVSRMVALERLAARAEKAGLSSAKIALSQIKATFTGNRGAGGSPDFPTWAACLAPEWRRISHLLSVESVEAWQKKLEQLCSPLSVTEALKLETAVATSFREGLNRPFSRWESMLRYALNVAFWPYVSHRGANEVETALRAYNPSHPERTVLGMSNPVTDQLIAAIESGDYSDVLGSNEMVLLNYHDMAMKPTEDGVVHVEVLCLLQPMSTRMESVGPQLDQSFRSSELPVPATVRTPFETCCRLEPEVQFLGSFTPAIPLPFFQNLVGAKNEDFDRRNWRYSRRNSVRRFGLPKRCGCSLSLPRKSLNIPPGFKLAWIVWLDDEIVTVVDERNNRMI